MRPFAWSLMMVLLMMRGALATPVPLLLQVHTVPPGAAVSDITPLYLGLQRTWTADGMGYPVEAATSHTLHVSMDGFAAQDVNVPAGQGDVSVTLQPATLGAFVSFVTRYRRGPLAFGLAVLLAALLVPLRLHRRRLSHMSHLLMAAEMDTRDLVGRIIDEYQVVEKIGEGAFSNVYKVEHVRFRDVYALKLLKDEAAGNETLIRFHREMTTGRDLRHPTLVQVHAFGDYRRQPYILMKFLQGETLAERLAKDPRLTCAEGLRLFRQMAEGLEYAHGHDIVHRDLKPENIMLLPDGSLRIMDFGIAKFVSQGKVTVTGAFLGTPAYMSPEHLNSGNLDHRADIYSAGVILYEMLAGRGPFIETDALDFMLRHAETLPPPLSTWMNDLNPALEALVMRMLEKRPDDRFQTMSEVLAAMDAL